MSALLTPYSENHDLAHRTGFGSRELGFALEGCSKSGILVD